MARGADGSLLTARQLKEQTKNGDMIKQLKADRILIQDLFEMPVEKETNKEK